MQSFSAQREAKNEFLSFVIEMFNISDFSMNLQDHQEQHLSKINYKVVVLELFWARRPKKGPKMRFLKGTAMQII